eukprot:3951444-Alexandrium_andersonii.AAC.1
MASAWARNSLHSEAEASCDTAANTSPYRWSVTTPLRDSSTGARRRSTTSAMSVKDTARELVSRAIATSRPP